ncbi:MAG TPA: ATPase [Lutibacter sp.]|nr:ATPase [Lutibacter sp.]
MNNNQKKIVLTGAPGTGKSTVIHELEKRNYFCMHEISRDVTLEAQKNGTDQLFLTEPLLFSDMLLKGRTEQYQKATKMAKEMVFFDRGIPDVHGYLNYISMEFPDSYIKTSRENRYDFVFLMPPWEDIYVQDNERYENFEQALAIHNHLLNTYKALNYNVIQVPTGTVDDRTDYILNVINTLS